jgi:Family of unknown function (DUF5335)
MEFLMGTTRRIPQDQLTGYFGAFTRRFLSDQSPESVDVEVLNMEWGDQFAAHGNRLRGITYDAHANTLEFELVEGDHRVYEPQEVWAVEEPDGFVSAVQVVRPDGSRDVARVRRRDIRSDEDR